MKIAVVGDIGIDEYTNLKIKKPGGIAFNVAANVLASGETASLISAIGNDPKGGELQSVLKKIHIDSTHVHTLEGKTALQKIHLEKNGERTFTGYYPGVLNNFFLSDEDLSFISRHTAVYVPLSDGLESIFNKIRELSGSLKKIVDFSQDSVLSDFDEENNVISRYSKDFDIIFVGGSENLSEQLLGLSKTHPEKVFVLTLGEKGSIAFQAGNTTKQKAEKIDTVVDTTGCGDAFQAGFLAKYLKNGSIPHALAAGTHQAGTVITRIGSTKLILKK